ncbi:E3 ubiquitin-protein ligase MPSR1-like [Magnolia sinica]|uniref:E3 ubiquitin-protein ligase MPSR1-like n=1 Tax=Magnolia sinica TaxID=86752 RepID=UPI002657DAC6|nr:E3 ubiquitin-protein ligase MPSR1-like [Magnolia sinica]
MVFHLNIHTDCIDSVALNVSEIAKKAHEAGKKIVHVVAEFEVSEIFVLIEEDEEDEEERLARVLRELMDLAFERRVSTVPALRSSVEALKRMNFNNRESDEIKCTICLNEFSIGKEVICMPCSHIFDSECIIQWMEMNHVCPICRFKMPPQQYEEI